MAWEKRSNGRWYYYRSRVGGRVSKEYLGGPCFGRPAEEEDVERRARLAAERQETERLAEGLDVSARPVVTLEAVTNAMIICAFQASGLHRHHRGE